MTSLKRTHLNPIFRNLALLALGILAFSWILLNRSHELIRVFGERIDSGFGAVYPIIAVLLYIAFIIPGFLGESLSISLTLAVFVLILTGAWSAGHSASTVIGGLIPLRDARAYYQDAINLIYGLDFVNLASRRPLFSGLLAVFLKTTGLNLMLSLAIFAFLNGISCYLFARTIQRTTGTITAITALIILIVFYRIHSTVVMTEQVGFSLGVLGLTLVWGGYDEKSEWKTLFGLLLMTLAMNARPGAVFVLLFIVIWGEIFTHDSNGRISKGFLLRGSLVVVIGFALNILIVKALARSDALPFSNFAHSFYGLASGGKPWYYIFHAHPEIPTSEPQQSKEAFRLAIELIRSNPTLLIKGVLIQEYKFFTSSSYGAYSYIDGYKEGINIFIQRWLYILAGTGLLKWYRNRNDPYTTLATMGLAGMLASVPFAPPGDANGLRAYAASITFLAVLPGFGMQLLLESLPGFRKIDPFPHQQKSFLPATIGVVYIIAIIAGPFLVKALGTLPQIPSGSCSTDKVSAYIRYNPGSDVTILKNDQKTFAWNIEITHDQFRKQMHNLSRPIMFLQKYVRANHSMVLTRDFKSGNDLLIVMPSEMRPPAGKYILVCGHSDPHTELLEYYAILRVDSIQGVDTK